MTSTIKTGVLTAQEKSTLTAIYPINQSLTVVTETWTTVLSVTVTPPSTSTYYHIIAQTQCSGNDTQVRLARNSTGINQGVSSNSNNSCSQWIINDIFSLSPMFVIDNPNTTSSTTYSIQFYINGTTVGYNKNNAPTLLFVIPLT